jgi:Domain of unknown function (DUF5047)
VITVSAQLQNILKGGGYTLHARATVTLDGLVVAGNVPIADGTEEYDASLSVPERVTITVPRIAGGYDWSPTTETSPLSAFGQRLKIQLGVDVGNDGTEWFDRGEYVIYQSTVDGDQVQVSAVGLLYLVDEARLVSPYQPTGTIVSTIRGLVEPALTVSIDPALTDRAVPAGINFDEDRLGALQEVLDAWPARALTMPDGTLSVYPDTDPATSWALRTKSISGQIATIVRLEGGSTRDGTFNAVVARGTAPDGGQLQAVAYDLSGSATSYGGPFNPLPVPFFYSSPLLTTAGQCTAAARTVLARKTRQSYGRYDVQTVPCPILSGGDTVTVTDDTGPAFPAVIEKMSLPYTPSGPMLLTLRGTAHA